MINFIKDISNPLLDYIKDDPVRPELSKEFRVGPNRFVSVLGEEQPKALVCVSLIDHVPEIVDELVESATEATTAVFYTIWSYYPGAGTEILLSTVERIKKEFPNIKRFVTLSPKTEMARKFHLKNGAEILRENLETINYEYKYQSSL